MKETGIIMSGNHPQLIFAGKKTMTRRTWGLEKINRDPARYSLIESSGAFYYFRDNKFPDVLSVEVKCPYGQVGDLLWVRETIYCNWGGEWRYKADNSLIKDGDFNKGEYFDGDDMSPRPSIFMPRWASRILLEITGLRAERLQEVSREDIRAEGIVLPVSPRFTPGTLSELHQEFQDLWGSLNAKRGYPFDFNPWVWPISFKEVKSESRAD